MVKWMGIEYERQAVFCRIRSCVPRNSIYRNLFAILLEVGCKLRNYHFREVTKMVRDELQVE